MVGTSSNRKVARAARTAGGRRRSNTNAPVGWYTTLAIICIVGIGLVWFSRDQRLDANNPGSTPPLAPSPDREGDNWLEAYGIYICDKYVPNINSDNNPYGISTQNDGIIHISPFEKKYAGNNATVDLFAKAVDLEVDRDSIEIPGDPKVYKAGEKCGEQNGKFVVKEWTDATKAETGREVKSNPRSLLLKDNYALAFAFIPENMNVNDIPLPESAANLAAARAAIENATTETTGTVPPGSETETTATTAVPSEAATTTVPPAAPETTVTTAAP